jgi:hypothetical protein
MRFTVLTLVTTAAIAGSAWSQDTNADNTAKHAGPFRGIQDRDG